MSEQSREEIEAELESVRQEKDGLAQMLEDKQWEVQLWRDRERLRKQVEELSA